MQKLFFILSLFAIASSQVTKYKPGECPPLPNVGVCEVGCFADYHCAGNLKCCQTACGGTFCVKPVTTRQNQRQGKQGSCPAKPTGPWVCSSRCAIDNDCRGNRKCCRNRCGAMACSKPEL